MPLHDSPWHLSPASEAAAHGILKGSVWKAQLDAWRSAACGPRVPSQDCVAGMQCADQLLWLEVFSGDFYGHNYGKRYDNMALEKGKKAELPNPHFFI